MATTSHHTSDTTFRVTALLTWAVLMLIVWTLFVPRPISVGTFTLLGITATLALAAVPVLRRSLRPSTAGSRPD